MALGLTLGTNNALRNSILTALIVLCLAIVNNLPEKTIPNLTEVYIAIRLGIVALITFYAVNKAIETKNGVKGR